MSDIAEYERRITAALARANQALEKLESRKSDAGESTELAAELEAERMANAQLEERVRAIKDKQETTLANLEREVARLGDALKARDSEVEAMRAVNQELRTSNASLRKANAAGLADAELVNDAMAQELKSTRKAQQADRAEIDEILATLEPILKEA